MTRDEAFAVLTALDDDGVKTTLEPMSDTFDGPGEGFQLKISVDSLKGTARVESLLAVARSTDVSIIGEFGNVYLR